MSALPVEPIHTRKGARNKASIPSEVLHLLQEGKIQSANLVEWLAVEPLLLLERVLTAHRRQHYYDAVRVSCESTGLGINAVHCTIGGVLGQLSVEHQDTNWLKELATHPSDIVRGWACYAYCSMPHTAVGSLLSAVQPFAADGHFGVRETAWMAARPYLARQIEQAIALLVPWTRHPEASVRRFATEVTRPCGVWCTHLPLLQQQPQLGLPLLEPLRADASRYVCDSVANWLNDAAKSRPDFVIQLCDRWSYGCDTPATKYIVRRALRRLR